MTVTTSTPQPFPPGQALQNGSDLNAALAAPAWSVAAGLVAAGVALASALQLRTTINQFATVGAATGAALANLIPGQFQDVYNDGASALTVYSAFATIDGTAGATGVALANAKRCRYTCVSPGVVESAQLGAVSA